jgi:acyl carrier protein
LILFIVRSIVGIRMNDQSKSVSRKPSSLLGSLLAFVSPSSRATSNQTITPSELTEWLIRKIADATGMPAHEIDLDTTFADFGLDSRTAVSMSAELEKLLGRELPPTLIWDFPTIKEVTHHLCAPASGNTA